MLFPHHCPSPSKLLLEAIPKLRAQFAAKANKNSNVFPLLTPQQHAWVEAQWRAKRKSASSTTTNSNTSTASNSSSSSAAFATTVHTSAAVLVPLLCFQGQPSILFTKRASHLSRHASEVSFPGGHTEAGDASLTDTAIREAMEELAIVVKNNSSSSNSTSSSTSSSDNSGLLQMMSFSSSSSATTTTNNVNALHSDVPLPDASCWLESLSSSSSTTTSPPNGSSTATSSSSSSSFLEILGNATTLPSKRYWPVTPVVAVCPIQIASNEELHALFPGNPQEVEHVFCVSIQELLQVETSLPFGGRITPMAPRYELTSQPGGIVIWGLTAYILQPLLHDLFQPVLLPQWSKKTTTTRKATVSTATQPPITTRRDEDNSKQQQQQHDDDMNNSWKGQ